MINSEFVYFQRRRFFFSCVFRFVICSSFLCDSISTTTTKQNLAVDFSILRLGNFISVLRSNAEMELHRHGMLDRVDKPMPEFFVGCCYGRARFQVSTTVFATQTHECEMQIFAKISLHSVTQCCTLSMMIYAPSRHAIEPSGGSREAAALFHTQHDERRGGKHVDHSIDLEWALGTGHYAHAVLFTCELRGDPFYVCRTKIWWTNPEGEFICILFLANFIFIVPTGDNAIFMEWFRF